MAEPPDSTAAPRIKITGLHIAGYRSLRRVDWPEDGLDWRGEVPDTVLVGGANGSGKTTLLELIFDVVRFWLTFGVQKPFGGLVPSEGLRIELTTDFRHDSLTLRFDDGSDPSAPKRNTYSFRHDTLRINSGSVARPEEILKPLKDRASAPRLIYFPTDRSVRFPATEFKGPGRQMRSESSVYRYTPPKDWLNSVEAILYEARWRDLNAKERGKQGPGHFAAFERVMQRFFAGAKQLYWDDDGVLHVRTQDGALHPLEALSSGEKQILLFAAELVDRWTPGSLVLIDEPELHLHEAWLAALWDLICELQQERGGQVIVATQSNYLFGLGGPGTHVLLGGWKP